jgi:hypothetical protein
MIDPRATVLEHVTFRLMPETDQAALDAASSAADAFLAIRPGFLGRALTRRADGTYVDLVSWRDQGSAEAASAAYLADPVSAGFGRIIDPTSLEAQHLDIVAVHPASRP